MYCMYRYPSLATAQSLLSLWNWLQAETEEERSESLSNRFGDFLHIEIFIIVPMHLPALHHLINVHR